MLTWVLFAAIGSLAGILGGMFGIGGGVVTVPALYALFRYFGMAPGLEMDLAIGTSLASMVFNSLAATWQHNRRKGVIWSLVGKMTPGVLLGSITGAFIAFHLPGAILEIFFGLFLCALAVYFLRPLNEKMEHAKMPHPAILNAFSFAIGAVSNILGIGGGVMIVPVLLHHHVSLQKAIGSSAAVSSFILFLGALSYLFFGKENSSHIPNSIGFIYIPAFIVIAIFALFTARIGVTLAYRLPIVILRRLFAVVLALTGLSILFF